MVKLLAVVLVVTPLPKFQERLVIVPEEVSVKVTASGTGPLVGVAEKDAAGTTTWPQQTWARMLTVSRYQPVPPLLLSVPARHLNWTCWPAAEAGRLTRPVMKPLELPLQAERPPKGLLNELLRLAV